MIREYCPRDDSPMMARLNFCFSNILAEGVGNVWSNRAVKCASAPLQRSIMRRCRWRKSPPMASASWCWIRMLILMPKVQCRCRLTLDAKTTLKMQRATKLSSPKHRVRSQNIVEHRMHAERFSISAEGAMKMNNARRIAAVGTTVVRVLESAEGENGKLIAQTGSTDIFIFPPYRFQAVDLLLTNFHLPRSTLLMLVSAFAGREFLLRAYQEAICQRYRFYSYG